MELPRDIQKTEPRRYDRDWANISCLWRTYREFSSNKPRHIIRTKNSKLPLVRLSENVFTQNRILWCALSTQSFNIYSHIDAFVNENFELNLRKTDAFEKWLLNFFTRCSHSGIHYTAQPIVVWKTENTVPIIEFSLSTDRSFSCPQKQ